MPKLNQQNLIISRVAVSFNSSLYLCAFYAPYSELLQSLKSIKLAPSIFISSSISCSFFLSHSTTKKQREMRTRQCWLVSLEVRKKVIQQTLTVPHTTGTRDANSDGCVNWHEALCARKKLSIKRFLCWLSVWLSAENNDNIYGIICWELSVLTLNLCWRGT